MSIKLLTYLLTSGQGASQKLPRYIISAILLNFDPLKIFVEIKSKPVSNQSLNLFNLTPFLLERDQFNILGAGPGPVPAP